MGDAKDDGPIRDLLDAWQELPAPDPLETPDPLTEEVIGWTRAAWKTLPTPPLTTVPGRRHRLLRRSIWRRGRVAAAAVIVAAGLAFAGLAGDAIFKRPGTDGGDRNVAQDGQREPATDDQHGQPASVPDRGAHRVADAAPRVSTVRPDGVELRSGPVRLLLVHRSAND